ncbi:MAG: glycogen/starch/alpha-glucan phosphorylase [Gammaproteobacteria bacterium]
MTTRNLLEDVIGPGAGSRTSLDPGCLTRAFAENLFFNQGRFLEVATSNDLYMAMAYSVRDRLLHRWITSAQAFLEGGSRTVAYLSAEFLLGPHLGNNLINLGIENTMRAVAEDLGLDFDGIIEQEAEPGLGNGGLGRLAACYMDSLATLEIPAIGYGIRYEFGIFRQEIEDGWQKEVSDKWLRNGNPWEIARPELTMDAKLGGHVKHRIGRLGTDKAVWVPERIVKGVAYDTPILGYDTSNANLLRLWSAEAEESFNFESFNTGDYYRAVEEKVRSENLTKVLYPNDAGDVGKRLRLEQQYFFVTCALQDMVRIYRQRHEDLSGFHKKFAVQLNDTHPSIAVAELMRLLVDEHRMDWDAAWTITRGTFAYTNHTLLPEALEKWPLPLFERVLPRHLEIIYAINDRFLDEVRMRFLGDDERVRRMSIIDEEGPRYVRMAHLAVIGSHTVNGVAELHSKLLKDQVLRDFHELWPRKFTNVTNGVTPRRFMLLSNPRMSQLIDERVGKSWRNDLTHLRGLEEAADDEEFRARWRSVKEANKRALCRHIGGTLCIQADPASLFDIQVKRIHEYKRQHLNLLHIVHLYRRIKHGDRRGIVPRTFLFAGKAAPGYDMAKRLIKLIHGIGDIVNNDPDVNDLLRVVFLPNYNVKNAQRIYPAGDLSEQISMAGKEASGTGNMKLALNGALTIGTLDGANIEIRDAVGSENFFLFGLTTDDIERIQREGYRPETCLERNEALRGALELIGSGHFAHGSRELFQPVVDNLSHHDPFFVLADFEDYIRCQEEVSAAWLDGDAWARRSILNVARMGRFSSDRSIAEYARNIWKAEPVPVAWQAKPVGSINA